jgi:HAD superfamily hydrolase (TIGR01509 family)
MSIRSILFDLDGVLVDATEIHYRALNRALKDTCGFEIDRSEHELKFNGLPTKTKLSILIKQKRVLDNQLEKIYQVKQKYTISEITQANLYNQDKIKMIIELKRKHLLGVVTNCSQETAMQMLRKLTLSASPNHYFSTIITNEQVRFNKPHPEGYIKAMINIRSYTLILEDNENGIVAAHATGANVVKVDDVNELDLNFITRYLS